MKALSVSEAQAAAASGPDSARPRSMTKSNKLQKLISSPLASDMDSPIHPSATAVTSKDPKLVYHLSVRISEARGLAKEGFDAYCSVNVDAARRRTRSVPKTSNPLWTDEFNFEVLDPTTSKLLLGVWDESSKGSGDRLLAKAEIGLDNLSVTSPEQWFPLVYGRREAYVSGGLHIRIDRTMEKQGTVIVSIVEAKNLASLGKGSQEFCVRLEYGKQSVKTKSFSVKDKDKRGPVQQDPEWNESFEIKTEPDADTFTFYVVNKSNSNTCVGFCSLTRYIHYFDEKFLDKWLVLEPEPDEVNKERNKQRETATDKCGDVRVTLKLNKVVVYPLEYYEPLIKFLFEEEGKRCVEVLEKTTIGPELRNSISQTLVRIYEARNKAPSVLRTLISHEVDDAPDVETLFRANSIGSKAVDSYMKLVGFRYLQSVASDTVDELYSETKKSCEVDPMKLDKGDDPKKNFKFLQKILQRLIARLYETVDECPTPLRGIFQHIQQQVERKFPSDNNVKYTGVSGFLFLRFICAAILGPKMFDLKSDHPSPIPLKNLTVVAKTLQRIANMAPTTLTLEGCLGELEKFVENEKENMRSFLNKISTPNDSLYVFDPAAVDLQHELSNLQESLEKQLDSIVAAYSESSNPRVAASATQLLMVLEQMNDGRHEAIFTKASREKRTQDPEAPLELTAKYTEILRRREEKARQIQEAQAEYNRQQALLAERGEDPNAPKKDDIKIVALPDDVVLDSPSKKELKSKQSSFIGLKRALTASGSELSPRSAKEKEKGDKDKKERKDRDKDKDKDNKDGRKDKPKSSRDRSNSRDRKEKDKDRDPKDKERRDKDKDRRDKDKDKDKTRPSALSVSFSASKTDSEAPDSPTRKRPAGSESPKGSSGDKEHRHKEHKDKKDKKDKKPESKRDTKESTQESDEPVAESEDDSNSSDGGQSRDDDDSERSEGSGSE
jgi:hypothetical protein